MITIEEIKNLYGKKLWLACYKLLRNKEEANDAYQVSMIKIWKALPTIDEARVFQFVYSVAVNTSLDILRKRKTHQDVSLHDLDESFFTISPPQEKSIELQDILDKLGKTKISHVQKTILNGLTGGLGDCSAEFAAKELGIKASTYRFNRKQLAKRVKEII